MGRISTHVLDTMNGRPAAGVAIVLERIGTDGARERLAQTRTNADGRTDAPLLAGAALTPGVYEIGFSIGDYFRAQGSHGPGAPPPELAFLDIVPLRFGVADADAHYHVPLLASPFAYSTYRGS